MENKNYCEDKSRELSAIIIDKILEDIFENIQNITNGGRLIKDFKVFNSNNSNQSSNDEIPEENKGEDDSNSINNATISIIIENNECSDDTIENALKENEAPLKYLRDNIEGKGAYKIMKLLKNEWFSLKDLDISMSRLTSLAVIFTIFSWVLR